MICPTPPAAELQRDGPLAVSRYFHSGVHLFRRTIIALPQLPAGKDFFFNFYKTAYTCPVLYRLEISATHGTQMGLNKGGEGSGAASDLFTCGELFATRSIEHGLCVGFVAVNGNVSELVAFSVCCTEDVLSYCTSA